MKSPLADLHCLDLFLCVLGGELENADRLLDAIDRDAFGRWCLKHQLGGLSYLLCDEASPQLPRLRPLLRGFRAVYLDQWARTERLRLTLQALARVMREADEPFLVLKGLPFAQKYYGGSDRRATGDLDLWVPRARAQAVAEVLERQGALRRSPRYRDRSASFDHVHQVELEFDGTPVELHHALRVHPTFSFSDARIWNDRLQVTIHDETYATLSHEHALLLHLLGLHTDVQIGQVTGRWFADLFTLLRHVDATMDWTMFFEARREDGTAKICVNSLAMFFVLTRRDDLFPCASRAVAARDADIVLAPDRSAYVDLLRGVSLAGRKLWPLKQYHTSIAAAAGWWLSGLPRRVAAKPDAFAHDIKARPSAPSPWGQESGAQAGTELEDELGVPPATLQEAVIRFGSIAALVRYERASDLHALRELFRLHPRPGDLVAASLRPGESATLVIYLLSRPAASAPLLRLPRLAVVEHPLERGVELHEGIIDAWLTGGEPQEAYLLIDRRREASALLLHAMMIVVNKILARRGLYHLHAAAVLFNGSTLLFVGGKGSGKSTISLALARAGGTIFSEDHVMLRYDGREFWAAGCDANMHLTATTEAHFFQRPLEGRLVPSGGATKKQIDLTAVVEARPYVESRVSALFFPTVNGPFGVSATSKDAAVRRVLEPLLERHRFAGAADTEQFLELFVELVESCETWSLSLSSDLADLDRLVAFLGRPREGAASDRGVAVAIDPAAPEPR